MPALATHMLAWGWRWGWRGDGGPGPHTHLPGGPGGLGHASDVSHIPEGSRHPLLVGLDWGLPGGRFGLAMVTCLARPPGPRPKPNALPEFGGSGAPLFLARGGMGAQGFHVHAVDTPLPITAQV